MVAGMFFDLLCMLMGCGVVWCAVVWRGVCGVLSLDIRISRRGMGGRVQKWETTQKRYRHAGNNSPNGTWKRAVPFQDVL